MLVNTPRNGVDLIFMRFVAPDYCQSVWLTSLQHLLEAIHSSSNPCITDVLNQAFHTVDEHLSRMCEASEGKIHSGCTAVTAFLRLEDSSGQQSFLSPPSSPTDSLPSGRNLDGSSEVQVISSPAPSLKSKSSMTVKNKISSSSSRIRKALRLGGSSNRPASSSISGSSSPATSQISVGEEIPITIPPSDTRRVLYSANAGDARGVLCRAGKAVRLTYDHKGSDKQEAKRITDAGGFVMSGRVNGVLAVTRALGDSSMKEFVVGAPYTTETELCEEDEFLILACDGVRDLSQSSFKAQTSTSLFSYGMLSLIRALLNLSAISRMHKRPAVYC